MRDAFDLEGPFSAVVIGARGGLGEAFLRRLLSHERVACVYATSRDALWRQRMTSERVIPVDLDLANEASVEDLAQRVASASVAPRVILNCSGLLHAEALAPERSWRDLDVVQLVRLFQVNTLGVALLVKHLVPLLPRRQRSVFVTLSARVGSIEDNHLGGWYGYRASKAASNMIIKTASIEARRRHPDLVMASLHPGTVDSDLSKPFSRRVRPEKLFSPEFSCTHLCEVIASLNPGDSGGFFAWDGQPIPW